MAVAWFVLTAASAGVFLHAGIKFPWFVFFQKDSGLRPPDPPSNMRWAMGLFAAACLGIGVFPRALFAILPFPVAYEPYTSEHLVAQFQLLLFAGLAFFVMLPLMRRTLTISLDWDWFYRRLGVQVVRGVAKVIGFAREAAASWASEGMDRLRTELRRGDLPHGALSRTWPTGSIVIWVPVLLAAYLLFYFL
jgi:multicomponent Na+:H+ antiporter subunit D